MIRLKDLFNELMTAKSEWDAILDKDLVLTNEVVLFHRDPKHGSFKINAGSVVHVESAPSASLAGSVEVSYKGELYTTDGQNLLNNSKIKK